MAEPWNKLDAELADTIEARHVARGTFRCEPDESAGAATTPLGHAESIRVEGMEDGFELFIVTEQGSFVVNVHAVTHDLITVGGEMSSYWAEGREAALAHQADLDRADAYDLRDRNA